MQQPSSQQPPNQQSTASGAATELKADAQQIGNKAADRLHSEVDNRKGEAVAQAKSVSSSIERVADGLDESTPAWLKSALSRGAEQIQRFADSIENKDSRQLMSEAQNYARNNPGTFLLACAAAGFAAARVLKAGGEQQRQDQFGDFERDRSFGQGQSFDQSQSWGDGEQASGDQFGGTQPLGEVDDNPMFQDAGSDPATRNRGEYV